MSGPTGSPPAAEAGGGDGLAILSPCPHCGGENAWRLGQTLRVCPYCGSSLHWPRPEGEPVFLAAEGIVRSRDDLLDVLQTLDAMRERARIAGLRPPTGNPDAPFYDSQNDPTLPPLHEIKARRRPLFALLEHRELLVPYLLSSSTLVFHALGRSRESGRKAHRSLFFVAEDLVPAYPDGWDFRDRGLWVARQRFRPFGEKDLARAPMRARAVEPEGEAILRPWRSRRALLESDLEPVRFEAEVFDVDAFVVYRPFHLVRARSPLDAEWLLVDGQFGTVAGYPRADEVERLRAGRWETLPPEALRSPLPIAVPFRCPECGADVAIDDASGWQLCDDCGRVLVPGSRGLSSVPYRTIDRREIPWWPHGRRAATAWLPFWRFEGSIRMGEKTLDGFASMAAELLPGPPARGGAIPDACRAWFLPAAGVLAIEGYDAFAFDIAAALTLAAPELAEARLRLDEGIGPEDAILPPSIRAEAFAPAMPRLLPSLLPVPYQLRLNPPVLARLDRAAFSPRRADLVFVPVPALTEGEGRALGPGRAVRYAPLRERRFPEALSRSVRRMLSRAKAGARARPDPRSPLDAD